MRYPDSYWDIISYNDYSKITKHAGNHNHPHLSMGHFWDGAVFLPAFNLEHQRTLPVLAKTIHFFESVGNGLLL